MPLIARQRSRLAVLAVLALVGSLLAVSAVPVAADHNKDDDTADAKAMYSACVGAATEDAGFTDMGNSFAAGAANCLVHYGITTGTGDGSTFSPDRGVSRLQMARFLSRAADPAGIDTMMVESQMLSDISDLSDEAQDAVNTVVSLGIMTARADDTFDPAGAVSRRDMAVHIAAFLSKALTGPGGTDIDDLKDDHASGATPFTDISGVSVAAHKAIRDIFELGVTTGTTDTTFSPNAPVSRAQMAAFITRALGHTNARPAGITAQGPSMAFVERFVDTTTPGGGDADISVSVRGDDHAPTPDASIGVISTETPDEAFDDAGECVSAKVTSSGAGCKITTSDEATDPDGNAEISVDLSGTAGTTTVWVWTGDTGDAFDADTTDRATVEIDRVLEATGLKVTVDTKKNAKFLKFGDTVTYTFQAVDGNGDAVAHPDASVKITATVSDTTDDPDGSVGDGALRDDSETTEAVHKTGADGSFQISFTEDDPKAGDANRGDEILLSLVLEDASLTLDVTGANDRDDGTAGIQIEWVDAASSADGGTLTLSSPVRYHEVDSAGGAVGNALMATLVDQYGDPVRGQKISVWSTVTNTATENLGLGGRVVGTAGGDDNPADNRTTNRNGVATKRYTRSGTTPASETLDASLKMVNGDCRNTDAGCPGTDEADTDIIAADAVTDLVHYWAVRATADVAADTVLVADKDNNSIVIGPAATPNLVTYKSGDYFQIVGASATMDAFEKALNDASGGATADTVAVTVNTASGINTFNITVNN